MLILDTNAMGNAAVGLSGIRKEVGKIYQWLSLSL